MISIGQLVVLIASLCIIGVANAQSNANMTDKASSASPPTGPIDSEDFLLDSPEQTAVLRCTMEDSQRGEYTQSWYKGDDKIVDDDMKYKIDLVNNTLSIKEIRESDLGPYICSFKSKEDEYNETVYLNSEPFVNKMDTSKNLVQGDPLNLDCHVLVYPNATVSWYKGDTEKLEESDRIHITTTELSEHGSVKTVKLRIDSLEFEDRDDYTCVAENLAGTFSSNSTILVRVKDKLAALWPFLGICAEVTILCIIIFIYERKRAKKMAEEESAEETGHLTNSHDHKDQKDDIRQRK